MQGGWFERTAASREQLTQICLRLNLMPGAPGASTAVPLTVDLGAGTGYQTLPLSEFGFDVVSIDVSREMLEQLTSHLNNRDLRPVQIVLTDLVRFAQHIPRRADLIVCMTDTLSHLPDRNAVAELFDSVRDNLAPGGALVLSFRDLSNLPQGDRRFLPGRATVDRMLTVFLEELDEEHVRVHDLLHTRDSKTGLFEQSVSSYVKTRLPLAWVVDQLRERGLTIESQSETFGMHHLVATL